MFHHSSNSPKNGNKKDNDENIKIEIDGAEFMKYNSQNLTARVMECRNQIIVSHFMRKHANKNVTNEEAVKIISRMSEHELKPYLFSAESNQQILIQNLEALKKTMIPGHNNVPTNVSVEAILTGRADWFTVCEAWTVQVSKIYEEKKRKLVRTHTQSFGPGGFRIPQQEREREGEKRYRQAQDKLHELNASISALTHWTGVVDEPVHHTGLINLLATKLYDCNKFSNVITAKSRAFCPIDDANLTDAQKREDKIQQSH